jgi:hypothetical protein
MTLLSDPFVLALGIITLLFGLYRLMVALGAKLIWDGMT